MSEILWMISFGILGWLLGRLYTEFQLEEMEKNWIRKYDDGNTTNDDRCIYQIQWGYSQGSGTKTCPVPVRKGWMVIL